MSLLKLLGEIFGIYRECPIVAEDVCPICLNPIHDGGRIDCCKHTFCLDCIQKWAEKSNHCPSCRKEFRYITPCKVFKDENELHHSYPSNVEELREALPSPRLSVTSIPSPQRGSGLRMMQECEAESSTSHTANAHPILTRHHSLR